MPERIKERKEDTKNGTGSVRRKRIATEYPSRQVVAPLTFGKMDIPIGIGHLYTNDLLKIILCNVSSACVVKEMVWAGLYTGEILTFRIYFLQIYILQINSINFEPPGYYLKLNM